MNTPSRTEESRPTFDIEGIEKDRLREERRLNAFAKVPSIMLRETELSLQAIGFYAILRDFNGHSGCYPKQATLAKRARISPRYTRILLKELKESGWIQVDRPYFSGSNHYYFPKEPDLGDFHLVP